MWLIRSTTVLLCTVLLACKQEYPCATTTECVEKFGASSTCFNGFCYPEKDQVTQVARVVCETLPLQLEGRGNGTQLYPNRFGQAVAINSDRKILIGEPGRKIDQNLCGWYYAVSCSHLEKTCQSSNGDAPMPFTDTNRVPMSESNFGKSIVTNNSQFFVAAKYYLYEVRAQSGLVRKPISLATNTWFTGNGSASMPGWISGIEKEGEYLNRSVRSKLKICRDISPYIECATHDFEMNWISAGQESAVSLHKSNVAVSFGASSVYVYNFPASGLNFDFQRPALSTPRQYTGEFGASLALFDNGLLVGSPMRETESMVYVYTQSPGSLWTHSGELKPPPGTPGVVDQLDFGRAMAVDKNLLVIGAPATGFLRGGPSLPTGDGRAFVYQWLDAQWMPVATIDPPDGVYGGELGTSVAVRDGLVVVGAPAWNDNGMALVTYCSPP